MRKPFSRALLTRQQTVEAPQWRLRCRAATLFCLVIPLFLVSAAGRSTTRSLAAEIDPAQPSRIDIGPANSAKPPQTHPDSLYDHFLQEFTPLRKDSERRQYIVRQILTAAAEHRVDPDLLFALIAVESGFNSAATSPKGARGLGQVMLTTARAIAPNVIHQAKDLYDIRRNLYVTALEVHRLLDKWAGNVWGALSEYSYGMADRHVAQHSQSPYVARICMYYALLKSKRHYNELLAQSESGGEPIRG